jgi:hypothetical protein
MGAGCLPSLPNNTPTYAPPPSAPPPNEFTMDPASAIGVASGVLSFVEATYKFLSVVYAVYESDQIAGYDELAAATDMVRELSQQMLSDLASTSPGPSVGGISSVANVAQQCHSLAIDLGNRLAKTKAKNRKLGDIVKAAVRTVCSKSDIDRLQRALDSCRSQLHLQLTLDHRYAVLDTVLQ